MPWEELHALALFRQLIWVELYAWNDSKDEQEGQHTSGARSVTALIDGQLKHDLCLKVWMFSLHTFVDVAQIGLIVLGFSKSIVALHAIVVSLDTRCEQKTAELCASERAALVEHENIEKSDENCDSAREKCLPKFISQLAIQEWACSELCILVHYVQDGWLISFQDVYTHGVAEDAECAWHGDPEPSGNRHQSLARVVRFLYVFQLPALLGCDVLIGVMADESH